MLNLIAFGAVPNDSSQSARAANALAWLAAMQAMKGPDGLPRANTLLISGGEFYFPGPVFMTRGCIIRGVGGSVNSGSMLRFPYNGAGIVVDALGSPDDPGVASWGTLENLDLFSEDAASIVQRRLGWSYTPGDIVISPGNDTLMFKCAQAGVSADPPASFDAANAGDTLVEASGTIWTALTRDRLEISLWQPNHPYEVGDIVLSRGFELASQHYGDNRFTYVCTAAGTSGAADPFGSQELDTEVSEPEGPTWRVNVWSAIVMRASIRVDNVSTYHWPNASIHVNSGAAPPRLTNANNFVLTNVKSTNDGMGIYVFGTNANAGFIGYCQVLGPGSFTPGDGGHGFWDHSLSSCLWIGNYAEDGSGAGWISDSVGKATWVNNTSEMTVANVVRQGAVTSLGNSPWHPTMLQQLSHFDLVDGRMLRTTDSTSRVTSSTERGAQGYIDKFWTTDEQGDFIGRLYNYDSWRRGWYTDHLIGTNGAFIGGVSGLMADEGPGHAWTAAGTFVGHYTEKRYFGYDPSMWESNRVREGKRIAGDVFITRPDAAPGEWMGLVVTLSGTKGTAWQPRQRYEQKRVGVWNLPADIVEPGDGFAYACTRSGLSGATPPPFGRHSAIGENAPVWTASSRYWPNSKVRPNVADGHCYRMKQYPTWTADTPVSPNQITTTGDSNGNLFFAYVQSWAKNNNLQVGQRMQPTAPDGRVFRAKRAVGALPSFGSTGAVEPDWSLLVGPGDELADGNVFWELDQLMTGSFEPPGVSAQTVGWDTQPGHVTYDNNIEWHYFVPMTGETEPAFNAAAGAETFDTPGATVLTAANGGVTIQSGFGVVWVESGLDAADSKVSDDACEWTRIDTIPEVAQVFPVGPAGAPERAQAMTLTLKRLSLTNVSDAAGRWQFEGGQVFLDKVHVADYAGTKRSVNQGSQAQNMAALTLTIFFTARPAENMTLQGSHDFASGDDLGSVSAASSAFASRIGRQFKQSGGVLVLE